MIYPKENTQKSTCVISSCLFISSIYLWRSSVWRWTIDNPVPRPTPPLAALMLLPLRISTGLSASSSSSLSLYSLSSRTPAATVRVPHCKSLRTNQDIAAVQYRESNSQLTPKDAYGGFGETEEDPAEPGVPAAAAGGGGEAGGGKGISGIQVPRQRYIAISKTELLDGILLMFESKEEIDQFLLLSS